MVDELNPVDQLRWLRFRVTGTGRVTLPKTNIAMENPPILMVFTRKHGDFHGLLLLVSGRVRDIYYWIRWILVHQPDIPHCLQFFELVMLGWNLELPNFIVFFWVGTSTRNRVLMGGKGVFYRGTLRIPFGKIGVHRTGNIRGPNHHPPRNRILLHIYTSHRVGFA